MANAAAAGLPEGFPACLPPIALAPLPVFFCEKS